MTSTEGVPPISKESRLNQLPKAKIVKREDFTDDLFLIWLETGVSFSFKPGQYITIGAGGIERPYSIASAPYESLIELFIEYVPPEHGGQLTPLLWAQHVGDIVSMRPRAKGIFNLQPKFVNHVMVGTVTGIAPYVSMLRQYIHDGETGHRFFVLEGASYQDEFTYDKELGALAEQHPHMIRFVPTVSRPQDPRNSTWSGNGGRVNAIVEEYLGTWDLEKEDTLIYACGHPGMIEDLKERLVPKGWNLTEERFWKEDD